mgnify:FL=1
MKPIRDRKLPERSKLLFEFPVPQVGGGNFRITLPFFENINITENKRAKYKKYDLISRSSQLYSYLGADSRKFSLEFVMSFPHILEEHGPNALDFIDFVESEDPWAQKKQFFSAKDGSFGSIKKDIQNKSQRIRDTFISSLGSEKDIGKHFTSSFFSDTVENVLGVQPAAGIQTLALFAFANEIRGTEPVSQHDKIIDLVMYWTNIIRSSVLNNSENPLYGPPIVRINHGILFQNIPCICTDYRLEPIEEGGYDVATLMPRRIRYTMNLEEIRAGDFGKFTPGTEVKQDNICGWEAVVSSPHQSVDPGVI